MLKTKALLYSHVQVQYSVKSLWSLNIRDFDLLCSAILLPSFWHFMTSSKESGWDRMTSKLASTTFLLLHSALSSQLSSLFHSCFMEQDSVSHLLYKVSSPETDWTYFIFLCYLQLNDSQLMDLETQTKWNARSERDRDKTHTQVLLTCDGNYQWLTLDRQIRALLWLFCILFILHVHTSQGSETCVQTQLVLLENTLEADMLVSLGNSLEWDMLVSLGCMLHQDMITVCPTFVWQVVSLL